MDANFREKAGGATFLTHPRLAGTDSPYLGQRDELPDLMLDRKAASAFAEPTARQEGREGVGNQI